MEVDLKTRHKQAQKGDRKCGVGNARYEAVSVDGCATASHDAIVRNITDKTLPIALCLADSAYSKKKLTSVKSLLGIALSLVVLGSLPLAASAQTASCVSCAIARRDAAAQSAANRALVQQQLQADLQTRLQTQQASLQNQQMLNTLNLRSSLDQNDAAIRQILLQEQLNLLQLQMHRTVKPASKKVRHP